MFAVARAPSPPSSATAPLAPLRARRPSRVVSRVLRRPGAVVLAEASSASSSSGVVGVPPASPALVAPSTPGLVAGALFGGFPLVAWLMRRKEDDASRPSPDRGRGAIGSPLPSPTFRSCAYLDYNATTPIFPEVAAAMEPFLWEHFGNPSSGHAFAAPCKTAVDVARAQVARMLGCDPSEIVFTSCGSESDNHAIASAVEHARRARDIPIPHVVTSAVEHPAILEYLIAARDRGELVFDAAPVDDAGVVSPSSVAALVRDDTCLVTVMHANNEVGAIQPVAAIAAAARAVNPNVIVHTDAAQSCGKVPVKVRDLAVDYATVVGHKIGAPKGVAALYVRDGAPFAKLMHGGGQEGGRRAGTENVLHVVGLGAAAALVEDEADRLPSYMSACVAELRRRLEAELGGEDGAGIRVNGPENAADRLPNTLSVGVAGISASALLESLSEEVAASAGAACHTGEAAATVSGVLRAMRVPDEYAVGTLRLSVGRHTTIEDVEIGAEKIIAAAKAQREEIAALPEGERPWWCVRNVAKAFK